MGKRLGLVVSLAVLVAMGMAGVASAAGQMNSGETKLTLSLTKDYTPSPWTSETGYSSRAVSKLGFGIKNLLLGWTDLFVEPKEASDAGGNLLQGIGFGLKDAVENTLGGAVHIVTFFLPQIDAPLPEGGTQVLGG